MALRDPIGLYRLSTIPLTETPSIFERTYQLDVAPAALVGRLMVRLQEFHTLRLVDMWRSGAQFETSDGSEVGQAVLELGEASQLRVRCWTLSIAAAHCLIQTVTAECSALLKASSRVAMCCLIANGSRARSVFAPGGRPTRSNAWPLKTAPSW